MHLLELGAFWLFVKKTNEQVVAVLMHLLALGAFWQEYTKILRGRYITS